MFCFLNSFANKFYIKDWNGKTLKNVYIINESITSATHMNDDDNEAVNQDLAKKTNYDGLKSEDFLGTFVDRKCSKCGHEGMTFSTRFRFLFIFNF